MLLGQGGLSAGCHPGPGQVRQPSVNEDFTIMHEEGPSWLKVPTSGFTFKTQIRYYTEQEGLC